MKHCTSFLIALAIFGFPIVAQADIDATGNWTWQTGWNFPATDDEVIQTGSALSWGSYVGTIDPVTGSFHVDGQPSSNPLCPYAPAIDGVFQADGKYVDGQLSSCIFAGSSWQYGTTSMHGARTEMIVCGDEIVDPGESCDMGDVNGVIPCCSATCTLDDPDSDDFCTEIDTCPANYNPTQDQSGPCDPASNPLTLTRMKVKPPHQLPDNDDSRVLAKGMLSGVGIPLIEAIDEIRIVDSRTTGMIEQYDHSVTGFQCTRKDSTRLDCETPDGSSSAQIRTNSKGTKLKIKLLGADVPPQSILSPVTLSVTDNFGLTRSYDFYACNGCVLP